MSPTWENIIRLALLEIGVIDPGDEGVPENDRDDALLRLKGMLRSWDMDGLLVPGIQMVNTTIPGNKTTYTIGQAGSADNGADPDIVVPRIIQVIETLEYRLGTNWTEVKQTSNMVITRYEDLSGARYPCYFFYNQAHPLPCIRFETITYDLPIRIQYRPSFETIELDDPITDQVPAEYQEALITNLAVKTAPAYGIDSTNGLRSATVASAARELGKIRMRNLENNKAPLDPALMGERQRRGWYGYGYGRW